MITGRNFAESYYEDEKLYSTGYDELDELMERAFCDGYEYAQREFGTNIFKGIKNNLKSAQKMTGKNLLSPENIRIAGQRNKTAKTAKEYRKLDQKDTELRDRFGYNWDGPKEVKSKIDDHLDNIEEIVKGHTGKRSFGMDDAKDLNDMASLPKNKFKDVRSSANKMFKFAKNYIKPKYYKGE